MLSLQKKKERSCRALLFPANNLSVDHRGEEDKNDNHVELRVAVISSRLKSHVGDCYREDTSLAKQTTSHKPLPYLYLAIPL